MRTLSFLVAAVGLLAGQPALAGGAGGENQPPKAGSPPAYGPGPVMVLKLDDEGKLLPTDGAISSWNAAYMKRCLDRARREKASLFLIEITTNGGLVTIMFQMSETLRDASDVRTATLVRKRAFSAGALVAMSTDDIYMEPGSVIGASTPVSAIPVRSPPKDDKPAGKPAGKTPRSPAEIKTFGALVAYFEQVAEQKGYPPALAAAMVDPDIEVVALTRQGKTELLTRKNYERAYPKPEDREGHELETVVSSGEIMVMGTKDSVKWGLARAEVRDRKALLELAGLADRQVIELIPTWADRLARFCSSGVVVALLILIAILGLYSEMRAPTGIGAAVFLAALATFFWANYLAGSAGPVSIAVFLIGLVLLLVEIFFIPGFGVAGISGIALMLVGMAAARIPPGFFHPPKGFDVPELRWKELFAWAVYPVIGGMAGGAAGIVLLMRFAPHLPIFRRLVLTADMGGAVVTAAQAAGAQSVESLVGLSGVAATKLRPGGSARFGEKLLDVVSDGEFLEVGAAVKIVSASGNRIVVRRA